MAQAVVDKAVRLHHDWYMSSSTSHPCNPQREDITLVLRNFNYPLPNAITSPTAPTVTFNPIPSVRDDSGQSTLINSRTEDSTNRTIETTNSSDVRTESDDGLGPDQKIDAYVDFSDFYRNFAIAKQNGTLPEGLDF